MAPTHRTAVVPLCLGLAFLPGIRAGRSPTVRDTTYRVAWDQLNMRGYRLLRAGRVDDALAFFQLNADNLPQPGGVHAGVREGCFAKANRAGA